MRNPKKLLLIVAGSMTALILFSIAILPLIIRSQAVKAIHEATGRPVRIEKVAINPFTLTVTISGFGIGEGAGAHFIGVDRVRVSLSAASIIKRALVVDEVTIDAPSVSFARLAANRYSFSDIIERLQAQPKKESKGESRFSINNISIHNGSISFDDRAVDGGRAHSVKNLEIAVPFISNIPYLIEKYTDPKFSAIVNGAAFSFGGKVKPLSRSMETSVRIDLKQLDLPRYVAYAPQRPPADLASGFLTVDSEIHYKVSADKKPELSIKGGIRLDNIALNLRNGRPLIKIPSLQINASRLDVFARQFSVESIRLDGPEVFASRDRKGEWMYSGLLPKGENKHSEKSGKSSTSDKPGNSTISVTSFMLNNGSVHLSDALPTGGFKTTLSEIDIAAHNISTVADTKADYELSMLLDNEAGFSADGTFSVAPLAANVSLELSDFKLQKGWPYLAQFLTAPVKGTVAASAEVSYRKEDGFKAADGRLAVKGLSARYGDREGLDLALLEASGLAFNQKENRATADDVRLSGGSISLSRESDGGISLLSLLKKNPADPLPNVTEKTGDKQRPAPVTSPPPATSGAQRDSKPLWWSLQRFRVERFNSSFTDKSIAGHPLFTLTNSQLTMTGLNGPKFFPVGLKFSSLFNRETPLKASGELTPLPFRYKGELSFGRLQIRDFEDYFPDNVNVFIIGGTADTAMNVDIALKEGKPVGSFKGSLGVRSFHCIDTVAEDDLLKWESLQLDDIQGTLAPFSLAIREVSLSTVFSRIVVRKDGSLNLQNLVDKPEAEKRNPPEGTEVNITPATLPTRNPAAAASPQAASQQARPPIAVGAITVQDGTIAFTDRHLPQTFSSTFYHMGGRVSGLSSEESGRAEVDLRGNLENHSPLQITGRINPLRDDLFVDLKISFKDIDLSPVTPYSGTYLGYTVEKGKLFLDLTYLIDKKQLTSENRIFIDQFTFGSKIESEKATSLPVRLAVALLKDRRGEIHLDLPVTGRTDDPKFSVWGVVWQVLKNLIVKAATSPFALLSSMFGGSQDFSFVQFTAGSSRLSAPEEQKLTALAKVLADRPGLKMEIKGYVEKERDAEGYRRELLEGKLRNEKFLERAKERLNKEGESADSIRILPEETSGLLKAVYKKEKFPKPRNAIGMVKDLPDDEMRKLIIASTAVGEPELQKLARERATSVMDYLVKKGGLPAERLFQKNDDIHKAPEKNDAVRSRVEFNAIAQ